MRGMECAGCKDHLAPRAQATQLLALAVFDTDRALALEQDAGGMRLGLDSQVAARCHERMDIGPRGAPALAVLLRDLVDTEAFLILGVEILANPKLRLARG